MPLPFLARLRPVSIASYAGFRNETRIHLRARVLRRNPLDWQTSGGARKFLKLAQLYASHELAGVTVRLDAHGQRWESTTDDEGFVLFDEAIDERALPHHPAWETGTLTLPDHEDAKSAPASLLAPGGHERLGIISDIDDTIVETGAHDFLSNWRRFLLDMPSDRVAVPGAAELYGRLGDPTGPGPEREPLRPFFYISSSPWNLYGFITEFMAVNGLPHGPMLLRDWGLSRDTLGKSSHGRHKADAIEHILSFYPDHRFILIGDDTQGDAAAYAHAVQTYPGRIAGVLIRTATGETVPERIAPALQDIAAAKVPLWAGPAYDVSHRILDHFGMAEDGETDAVAGIERRSD